MAVNAGRARGGVEIRERFILRAGLRLGVGAALSEVACARAVKEAEFVWTAKIESAPDCTLKGERIFERGSQSD